MGPFTCQECRRLIEHFLELKRQDGISDLLSLRLSFVVLVVAVSSEPECENAANGAVL